MCCRGDDERRQTHIVFKLAELAGCIVARDDADCVFPIALWQRDALAAFLAELAELGVARVSHASFLHRAAMEHFSKTLASLN